MKSRRSFELVACERDRTWFNGGGDQVWKSGRIVLWDHRIERVSVAWEPLLWDLVPMLSTPSPTSHYETTTTQSRSLQHHSLHESSANIHVRDWLPYKILGSLSPNTHFRHIRLRPCTFHHFLPTKHRIDRLLIMEQAMSSLFCTMTIIPPPPASESFAASELISFSVKIWILSHWEQTRVCHDDAQFLCVFKNYIN